MKNPYRLLVKRKDMIHRKIFSSNNRRTKKQKIMNKKKSNTIKTPKKKTKNRKQIAINGIDLKSTLLLWN